MGAVYRTLSTYLISFLCGSSLLFTNVLAQGNTEQVTAQEVLDHFKTDNSLSKTLIIIFEPVQGDFWTDIGWGIRMTLNPNAWDERIERKAKNVSFALPYFVHNPIDITPLVMEKITPILEEESMGYAQRDLEEFARQKARYEKDSSSEEDKKVIEDYLEERFAGGSLDVLYERYLNPRTLSVLGEGEDYYLLPVFYRNQFRGYYQVEALRSKEFTGSTRTLRQPWDYPLKVLEAEAASRINADDNLTPQLFDLSTLSGSRAVETLYWVSDSFAIGAMTGELFRLVDASGASKTVSETPTSAEISLSGSGAPRRYQFVLPLGLESLKAPLYNWDATPRSVLGSPPDMVSIVRVYLTCLLVTTPLIFIYRAKKRKS